MADGRIALRKRSKDVYYKTLDDASAAAGVLQWMALRSATNNCFAVRRTCSPLCLRACEKRVDDAQVVRHHLNSPSSERDSARKPRSP